MQWEHSPALYNDVLGNDGLPMWQWSIRILMDYKWKFAWNVQRKSFSVSLYLSVFVSLSPQIHFPLHFFLSSPFSFSLFPIPRVRTQCEWSSLKSRRDPISPGWCGSVGWCVILCTKRLGVWFLIRAHTYVVGSIPSEALVGGNWLMYLSLSKINKHIFLIRRKERSHQKSTMLES